LQQEYKTGIYSNDKHVVIVVVDKDDDKDDDHDHDKENDDDDDHDDDDDGNFMCTDEYEYEGIRKVSQVLIMESLY
jgi:ABC-type Zn2+ transport system substrate-binding protein/surface adhesin